MKNLPIADIMNGPPVTVKPDDRLDEATSLMEKHGVHHLLVMERDRIAGILSSADLLKLALLCPHGQDPLQLRVRDLMQPRVAVLKSNTSLKEAAQALTLGDFHALPIVAIDGTPVGMVTTSDLASLLLKQIDSGPAHAAASPLPPAANSHLLEVLRAAEVYLRSGQSDQQHARLMRAIERAREQAPECAPLGAAL